MSSYIITFTIFSDNPEELSSFYSKIIGQNFFYGLSGKKIFHTWIASNVKLAIMQKDEHQKQPLMMSISTDNLKESTAVAMNIGASYIIGPLEMPMLDSTIDMIQEDVNVLTRNKDNVVVTNKLGEMSILQDLDMNQFALIQFDSWVKTFSEFVDNRDKANEYAQKHADFLKDAVIDTEFIVDKDTNYNDEL